MFQVHGMLSSKYNKKRKGKKKLPNRGVAKRVKAAPAQCYYAQNQMREREFSGIFAKTKDYS